MEQEENIQKARGKTTSEPARHCPYPVPGEGDLGTTVQFPARFPAAGNEALQAEPGAGLVTEHHTATRSLLPTVGWGGEWKKNLLG